MVGAFIETPGAAGRSEDVGERRHPGTAQRPGLDRVPPPGIKPATRMLAVVNSPHRIRARTTRTRTGKR